MYIDWSITELKLRSALFACLGDFDKYTFRHLGIGVQLGEYTQDIKAHVQTKSSYKCTNECVIGGITN